MKLIWTYDGDVFGNMNNNIDRTIRINFYRLSIYKAKELGYYTIIYVDKKSDKYFIDLVDEVILVNDKYDYKKAWDYLKIYVLENRNDEFILIDGDVILNKKLPDFDVDIIVDTLEDGNWEIEYLETINQLKDANINSIINFWDNKKVFVINAGILFFKNNVLKKQYVKNWKQLYDWVILKNIEVNFTFLTMVLSQYLLTILSNNLNMKIKPINKYMFEKSEYYTHYFGIHKFESNLVPNDKLIKFQKTFL
jgi:hypothetical protein